MIVTTKTLLGENNLVLASRARTLPCLAWGTICGSSKTPDAPAKAIPADAQREE